MNRTNGKYSKPFYEDDSSYRITGFTSLAGCALLVLGSVLNWKSFYLKTTETERSGISLLKSAINAFQGMFQRDLNNSIVDTHITVSGILNIIFMLIFYVIILFLIIAGVKDNFSRKEFFVKYKKIIRISALIILIILMILLTHTVSYKNSIKQFEESVTSWISYIEMSVSNHVEGADNMQCTFKTGPAPICFWLGIISYFLSVVGCFVLDTLNEDDNESKEAVSPDSEVQKDTSGELSQSEAGEVSQSDLSE